MAQDTLNLDDEFDDQKVVYEAERLFGIKFGNDELLDTHNVGQFYDQILRKHQHLHPGTQACLTQAAFYRLRHATKEMGFDGPITPATPLSVVAPASTDVPAVRRFWKELGRGAGLTLPRLEVAWTPRPRLRSFIDRLWPAVLCVGFYVGSAALFLGIAVALEKRTGMSVGWLMFLELVGTFAVAAFVHLLADFFFATIPRRIETIGDLAREAAGHSFADLQLKKGGCSPSDVWYALTASLRQLSGHKAPIARDTTFFAKT